MRMLLVSFFIMAGSAFAAPIIDTQVHCPVVSGQGAMGCTASANSSEASVSVYPGANNSGSATASFQDDYLFTVTTGPSEGFFGACFSGDGDTYLGGDIANGNFGGSAVSSMTRAFSFSTCPSPGVFTGNLVPFTLGVPINASFSLYASVSTNGPTPQGFAQVSFSGLLFFDSMGSPISGVTYTLDEVSTLGGVPEPGTAGLLISGLASLVFLRRK